MSPQDKCTLSFYRDLEPVGDSEKVVLTRHIESGQLFVKKRLSAYSREMYHSLLTRDIPGIPHVYECLDDGGTVIVIEEYVPGKTLRQYLEEQGAVSEARAKEIVGKLCDVLVTLHGMRHPIVCRDLKPENVILSGDDKLYIVDLDAAKFIRPGVKDTVLLGTPGYAAPEQFGFAVSDERTDVYAAGVILNELLTGCLPADRIADGYLADVIRRATSIDPKERQESIDVFKMELSGVSPDRSRAAALRRRFLPPGFRTHTWWKMVLAVLAYSGAIFMAIMFAIDNNPPEGRNAFFGITLAVFWSLLFCWTVAYAFDYLGIRRKMPVNRLEVPAMRNTAHVVIWVIGCVVMLVISMFVYLLGDIMGR